MRRIVRIELDGNGEYRSLISDPRDGTFDCRLSPVELFDELQKGASVQILFSKSKQTKENLIEYIYQKP